jgi:hypothetical protein
LKILDRLVQAISDPREASTLTPFHHIAILLVVWQYGDHVLFAESVDVFPEVVNPKGRGYGAFAGEVHDLISKRHFACHMRIVE